MQATPSNDFFKGLPGSYRNKGQSPQEHRKCNPQLFAHTHTLVRNKKPAMTYRGKNVQSSAFFILLPLLLLLE
eukprot:970825-Amphidinium_carterae.1